MAARSLDVEIKGVSEFVRGAKKLASNIDDSADTAFKAIADQTATTVRSTVPKLTGRMAGSIIGEHADHGATVGYGDLVYAGPVDYGGWPAGRPYIPQGRYLYPIALQAADNLRRAGEQAAAHEIARMIWPTVMGI